jgi:hypothetical protein
MVAVAIAINSFGIPTSAFQLVEDEAFSHSATSGFPELVVEWTDAFVDTTEIDPATDAWLRLGPTERGPLVAVEVIPVDDVRVGMLGFSLAIYARYVGDDSELLIYEKREDQRRVLAVYRPRVAVSEGLSVFELHAHPSTGHIVMVHTWMVVGTRSSEKTARILEQGSIAHSSIRINGEPILVDWFEISAKFKRR